MLDLPLGHSRPHYLLRPLLDSGMLVPLRTTPCRPLRYSRLSVSPGQRMAGVRCGLTSPFVRS